MTKASYLITFISLIIALGISDLIFSLHRLFRIRSQIKWHWLPLVWTATIFISLIQIWYGIYHYLDILLTDTSAGFIILLLPVIFQIMMALAVLPDNEVKPGFDMRKWYFDQKNYLIVLMMLNIGSFSVVKYYQTQHFQSFIILAIVSVPLLLALRSKNFLVHSIVTILFFLLFLAMIIDQRMYLV